MGNKINLDQYVDQFWEVESQSLLSDIRLLEKDESVRISDETSPEELIRGIKKFLPKIEQY